MIVALDVMGFENNPVVAIKAARKYLKKNINDQIILVGDEATIKKNLHFNDRFIIHHANQVIEMTDSIFDVKRKLNSSMVQAIWLVRDKKADCVLSAGASGPFVAANYFYLGLLDNIKKIAFMPWMPTNIKGGTLFLDVGANKECTGFDLYQFAIIAKVYSENIFNKKNPSIKVVNIGTESFKGLQYHHDVDELLKKNKTLNYQGFIESRDILSNKSVDIVVSDGYSGNLVLKACEGSMKAVLYTLLKNYKKPWNWLGGIFSIFAILKTIKQLDYRNNAGAIVTGVKGISIKTHGSADYKQFYSALLLCKKCFKYSINEKIQSEINKK